MIKHKGFIGIALLVFVVEIMIATIFKETILRPVFGDFLVVILMYSTLRGLTNWKPIKLAIGVLVIAYLIEFGQLINILGILGIQRNTITDILLGSSFDWLDILAYSLGVLTVYGLDKYFSSKPNV